MIYLLKKKSSYKNIRTSPCLLYRGHLYFLFQKGDRVFTARTVSGGYAEYAVADVSTTQPLDDTLTFEQGAGIGVPYFTAYRAVRLV